MRSTSFSKCIHVLFLLPLTTTLESSIYNPSSWMRKLKLREDDNLPKRMKGQWKGISLYSKRCFCGANSDIVSKARCFLPFSNLLHMKTKSSGLSPQISLATSLGSSGLESQWRLLQLLIVFNCIFSFTILMVLYIWQVWNDNNDEIFCCESMYSWH